MICPAYCPSYLSFANTTLTFFGVAHEGDTLVYDIKIDEYAKKDGEISMFFFQYDCFVNGKLLIEMRGGCAGFFSDEDLAAGKGILYNNTFSWGNP